MDHPKITCGGLTSIWIHRWPRPDPETNRHNARMVGGFGRDFSDQAPDTIQPSTARQWALLHPGKVRYVRAMLNDALDDGLIKTNVFAGLRLPPTPEGRIVVPRLEQIQALTAHAAASDLAADAIIVAAYTGLRQGELRALAREDVSVDGRRLDIDWQLTRDDRLKRPKKESTGTIMAPPSVRRALHRRMGAARGDSFLRPFRLFPLSRDQLCRLWDNAREASGVNIRWHDLRHFCATWLLDNGATADDVAKQLRCDVDLVRRRYGHPDTEEALKRMEQLVL